MIHLLADRNLYKIKEFCPPETRLDLYDPEAGFPELDDTDALLVRTVTKVDRETFPNIPNKLRFIGTGSSGTDHLDKDYLRSHGLTLADATGCNASSVAEYVMTSLLLWKEEQDEFTSFGKVGIIGVGSVGTAVSELLQKFEIECILYDPPREKRDPDFSSASLEEVLQADILTFHTPLTKDGEYPTYHWLNSDILEGHEFKLIINAARGGVVDENALLAAHAAGTVKDFVIDVWEREPDFDPEVSEKAFIATPHIAGYSEQAKVSATRMVCSKLAEFFDLPYSNHQNDEQQKEEQLAHIQYSLKDLITRLHPILGYDKALRDLSGRPDKEILFRNLRTEWPFRYEYPYLKIREDLLLKHPELKLLGIDRVIK